MKIGELVTTKSITALFGDARMHGSAVFKPVTKGHVFCFLNLGTMDPAAPDTERFFTVLTALGWIPGLELQAQLDAEKAATKQE